MKILIADDDEIAVDLLAHTLESAGYEVETVFDGLSAAERIANGAARIVITDWDMPGLTGEELCRQVRAQEADGYIYMILLTGRNGRGEVVRGLSAGADDFIAKPFHPEELVCRVRTGERVLSLETREVAIFALAKLAESRDSETGAHLERVQRYSRVLAQQLARHAEYASQIDAEFIRLVYLTSPLHDIGKVGVPDAVLLKPGRLTPEEFEIMKTHATIGAATLDAALTRYPSARFLKIARDIAASHHERWDGGGYPLGLAGEDIPLAGRIVAVADVYDALTSKRVYKEAFSHEKAYALILGECGTHFETGIVRAFIEVEAEFLAIKDRYRDDADKQAVATASA